jgi:hypothetical protein
VGGIGCLPRQEQGSPQENRVTKADPSQRGFLSFSAILTILIFASLIFAALKLVPPYISNYELQDSIQNLALQASYSPMSEADILKAVVSKANGYGIDLPAQQIKVQKGEGTVAIAADYTVPVDLFVRQVQLHFEPSASNRQIGR